MDLFFNIEETEKCVDQSCLFSCLDSHEQILDIHEAHLPNTKPSFRDWKSIKNILPSI